MSKKGLKKEAVIGSVQESEQVCVTDEELALINKYTRRHLPSQKGRNLRLKNMLRRAYQPV